MSDNRVNQPPYKIKGTLVHGQGYGYNLTSKIDAEKLCTTLNELHIKTQQYTTINTKLDEITRQIIQLKLTINILDEEIQKLNRIVKE